jgi:hypothetical protein
MIDLMKKCWSPDSTFRPPARDLDMTLMDMSAGDVEPVEPENAKHRTGDMLYELFPRHVAEALKAGEKVEPETHELVTVIFSDIVHFTNISKELTPLKVSQMLDRLYLAFDKIARKHEVFKVCAVLKTKWRHRHDYCYYFASHARFSISSFSLSYRSRLLGMPTWE